MDSRLRTRHLRRAIVVAALGALVVPATAGADAKKTPVITKVTPKTAYVGTKLTIKGKHFKRGKGKNSVLFRRDGGKALFVKADVSTTKKLTVVVPKSLEKYMKSQGGAPVVTRFRVKVLASKLSKSFTKPKKSPLIAPERVGAGVSDGAGVPAVPDGDCDGDGLKNAVDPDDDNDLLPDALEISLKLDPCVADTDGDGVEDGFEYKSAADLNNDDYQHPNTIIPFPAKLPFPNPLFADADVDYDGDALTLADEYRLWKYTYEVNRTATRTLEPLSYSDGHQYSLSVPAGGNGRRQATMTVAAYQPPKTFRLWADAAGFGTVSINDLVTEWCLSAGCPQSSSPVPPSRPHTERDLYDMDQDGTVTTVARLLALPPTGEQNRAELTYWDLDHDGFVSDDERDEDADGLNNYYEASGGPMSPEFWEKCYSNELPYPIAYPGTKPYDPDSDGDGILDGADDQDFDDIPNIMELSRNMAGDRAIQAPCGSPDDAAFIPQPMKALVNPFNPCLPDRNSRTCMRHPAIGSGVPPFDAKWEPKILN
jgi:hypothetical protein